MQDHKVQTYIKDILNQVPTDWLKLTTHRLDIYNESRAKTEFLEQLEVLYQNHTADHSELAKLPTAYDYIRLGHPLSSVLEWGIAHKHGIKPEQVISFSSQTMPVFAVLRTNKLQDKPTQILYTEALPNFLDAETLKRVYGYSFELKQVKSSDDIPEFEGSTVFISQEHQVGQAELNPGIDFHVNVYPKLGSILIVNGNKNEAYVSEIQHVRRRESIAMTPADSFEALQRFVGIKASVEVKTSRADNLEKVIREVQGITLATSDVLLGSCGLSVQYAIMMGLIDDAKTNHPGKRIKIIVPPNCYGGTNDQARRVVEAVDGVDIMDLPVDQDNDMVQSTAQVLDQTAREDAVPYIIAEIPTNPRVEVPNLEELTAALRKPRQNPEGQDAIPPVFILDQTFCPNVHFLSKEGMFSDIRTISYVSGSKFPSGGRCTAGYCVANEKAEDVMPCIQKHFQLCDNEATDLQVEILAEQLPSMNQRIKDAYKNTREFVNFIRKELPEAKINFVPDEVVEQGFTPSVFSLDLPTKGDTDEERETYKRDLNHKLITMMISRIPGSKHCVSYGQLKGSYWTIPATSTQGTTKEEDKDYIARVSISPDLDLERHKAVFSDFVKQL
ncbi:cystathionine beta-synthase [Psychroflexus sp. YR1-1]|uniref:Cystathionine beta-synthase n=1 Tax=Psychroflexus aurantiacus TaxID=2709310 RepID=A0A6B3R2M8_9FLAO|nr:PLP-dependent transferase [Psychroflexus aurantiacus]NEV92965.1 cystathionine beta-synthase [Psychroflexus aurantiacus]